ncbi:MAG TPA: hypothetical protein PLR98_14025 [Chitinophagaceae bacterium]|nr:hypothetical protein [Chitinophagaceae bacterium]
MKIIQEIESTNAVIKAKDNSYSFNVTALDKFELIYFLTMEITRYELMTSNELSDLTSDAISQLFTFQCFEFYYRDYPEVYAKTSSLFSLLCEYNMKLKNNDLNGNISSKDSDWQFYFNQSLAKLLK